MTAAAERPYITCHELSDFLADYLADELSPEQKYELERHLAVCPSCVNYLDAYRQTLQVSRRLFAEELYASMPEELIQSILAARSSLPSR